MIRTEPELSKLRSDLIIRQRSEPQQAEGAAFVLKDPETGKFYRFREQELFVAHQLDGSTPHDTIRRRVEERFGAFLEPDALEQFIETLGRLGLLDRGTSEQRSDRRRGRLRGNLFHLRFKVVDPDRLLTWLAPKVRFCFTPYALAVSVAFVLLAGDIAIVNSGDITRAFADLLRLQTLFLILPTVFVVTTAHELAHGLTCKHYGGEVHEIGFMLIYFQPAFYCNVSDAWLFPEKSKRLWVTLAGSFCDLIFVTLAVFAWRLTEPHTWVNQIALVVMATSGIRSVFDFNPLIKMDGYYFLSDLLEIPNLRERAFRYLGSKIGGLWRATELSLRAISPRERLIYMIYGVLAGVYSFSLISYVMLKSSTFMVERYQGTGFVLFGLFAFVYFRKPLKKAGARFPAVLRALQDMLASHLRKMAVFVGVAAVLAILFLVRLELKVWGEFRILPRHNTDVRVEIEGIITSVHVAEGDLVQRGDPIATLSDLDYRAELRKTEADINRLQAKLKMLKAGPRREEVDLAQEAVETAQSKHEKAIRLYEEARHVRGERLAKTKAALDKAGERFQYQKLQVERFVGLLQAGFIAQKDFDLVDKEMKVGQREVEEALGAMNMVVADDLAEMRNAVVVAKNELAEAKGQLTVLLAGSRPEEIEAAEAEFARLETQQRYLLEQIQLLNVVSSISGMITTPTRQLRDMIGRNVKKGDFIAKVHELKTVTAEITVSEKEIADVEVGQSVILKARAHSESTFEGQVVLIATTASSDQAEQRAESTILVLTELDNIGGLLKPEMTGNARIYCGKRRLFDLVTRRIARYIRVEFWAWW